MQAAILRPGETIAAEEAESEAVVEVEENPEEPIVAEEAADEEPPSEEPEPIVLEETPSLGLSDEVFPAGAELAAEAEAAEAEEYRSRSCGVRCRCGRG